MLRATGLARPLPPTQVLRDTMVERALTKLMQGNCGGRLDSTQHPDGLPTFEQRYPDEVWSMLPISNASG